MKRIAVVLSMLTLGAAGSTSWLDAKTPANWNVVGAPIPPAPTVERPLVTPPHPCVLRPPTAPEDRAVAGKGWLLVGPYQRYGHTSVIFGTAAVDGMCRPSQYQGFVFVNGTFAGTLSPDVMADRSDGALALFAFTIFGEDSFYATYARYSDDDPLCCPHASTEVRFSVTKKGGASVIVPSDPETPNK
jgi:LppP/LprE lipoprotein